MNISSKIMALTMTALLTAGSALAADNISPGIQDTINKTKDSASSIKDSAGSNLKSQTNASGSASTNTGSSGVSGSADMKASTTASDVKSNGSMSTNVSSEKNMSSETQRVKSNMGLHRCGGNRGNGVGNMCSLSLTSMDKNKNGMISRREFRKQGLSAKLFNKIDVNHNGIISKSELSAYNKGKVGTGVNRVKTR